MLDILKSNRLSVYEHTCVIAIRDCLESNAVCLHFANSDCVTCSIISILEFMFVNAVHPLGLFD